MERTLTFTLGEVDALRESVRCKIADLEQKIYTAWNPGPLREAREAYRNLLEKLN